MDNVLTSSEPGKDDEIKPIVDQEQYLSWKEVAAGNGMTSESPIFNTVGLRVLAVDDSLVCLKVLVKLLHHCKYNVTETTNPVEALEILRTRKHEFDIVITDLRMLEMDGLVLLQKISLEMDLPVIMLSADDKQENIMKAIRYGARDYIIKPPRMAQIKNVWQHVVRKRLFGLSRCKDVNNNNNASSVTIEEEEETQSHPQVEESKRKLAEIDGDPYVEKGKANEEACVGNTDSSGASKKKRRVNWTVDLHNKFTDAIEKIGPKAVPMEILKVMNVPWLTRANVASHLQKFKNAVRSQKQSAPQATYSMGMMTQDISTNPYLPQKISYWRNNQNSSIFPQGTNKHLLNYYQHYNMVPMNPSAYQAPTKLNNAPLPPRNVLTSHPPVPQFNELRFSTSGNNNIMTNSYSLNQSFPAPAAHLGNMCAAASNVVNADSKQNFMLANGQNYVGLAPETGNMYPQLGWTTASDLPDTPMSNSGTRNFDADPFQTTQMETWTINRQGNVEVPHFHSTTHEELPIDASFQPINTNLSDEDYNDELNCMVNSFNCEGPPSL